MEKLWFNAKKYGWGWDPASWQGWVIMLAFVAAVVASAIGFFRPGFGKWAFVGYFSTIGLLVGLLFLICWKTGERPRWR